MASGHGIGLIDFYQLRPMVLLARRITYLFRGTLQKNKHHKNHTVPLWVAVWFL